MLPTAKQVVDSSEVIVLGNKAEEFAAIADNIPAGKIVFDLVRIKKDKATGGAYHGLAW